MAFDPHAGIALLDRHLARMKASALAFGIPFDRHATRNELQAATFRLREARRIRLLLAPSGAMAIQVSPLPTIPAGPVEVAIVASTISPDDFRARHKPSDRAFHDAPRKAAGKIGTEPVCTRVTSPPIVYRTKLNKTDQTN